MGCLHGGRGKQVAAAPLLALLVLAAVALAGCGTAVEDEEVSNACDGAYCEAMAKLLAGGVLYVGAQDVILNVTPSYTLPQVACESGGIDITGTYAVSGLTETWKPEFDLHACAYLVEGNTIAVSGRATGVLTSFGGGDQWNLRLTGYGLDFSGEGQQATCSADVETDPNSETYSGSVCGHEFSGSYVPAGGGG